MADRYALVFDPNPNNVNDKQLAYNGREWTFNRERSIWQLSDAHVMVFEGGDAISVDRGDGGSVETNFDMSKVNVAANITQSEA